LPICSHIRSSQGGHVHIANDEVKKYDDRLSSKNDIQAKFCENHVIIHNINISEQMDGRTDAAD
jgi:hypothetical protein